MKSDLVAMLRKEFSLDMKHEYPQTCLTEYEYERQKASDHIEKLEAALRDIASGKYSGMVLTSMPPQDPAVLRAKQALEQTK